MVLGIMYMAVWLSLNPAKVELLRSGDLRLLEEDPWEGVRH